MKIIKPDSELLQSGTTFEYLQSIEHIHMINLISELYMHPITMANLS